MKAKKRYGQNFLIDNNIIKKITDEVSSSSSDLIIEIGPGKGALTKELKKKDSYIIAYEIDTDLVTTLEKLENEKVKVIYKDILTTNIKEDINNINYSELYIVGNLPYYITTPIIEHIIKQNLVFKKFTIMVQKEVADRFMAKPKSKDYGYITLVLKYFFDTFKVCDVSKYSFNPVPKVESAVISFIPKVNKEKIDVDKYFNFLKIIFRQKRKTLKNNVSNIYNWDKIIKVLARYNISESCRAEELEEQVILDIFKSIS